MVKFDFLYESVIRKFSSVTINSPDADKGTELAFLIATLDIFRMSADHALMAAFFLEFMQVLENLPPQSLSLVWGRDAKRRKILGCNDLKAILTVKHNNANLKDIQNEYMGSSVDHDPVQVVYRLVEACKQSILMVYSTDERVSIFQALLAMSVKSCRASLLLESVWQLSSFTESIYSIKRSISSTLNGIREHDFSDDGTLSLNILLLKELKDYVDVSGCGGGNAVCSPSSAGLRSGDADTAAGNSNSEKHGSENSKLKVCVSFGKADHGKLGHGDTVVSDAVCSTVSLFTVSCSCTLTGFRCVPYRRFIARYPRLLSACVMFLS